MISVMLMAFPHLFRRTQINGNRMSSEIPVETPRFTEV
jgi:hypothetical protein